MRSPVLTFLLALATFLVCGLAAWSLQRGNLDDLFGAPRTVPGELLYPGFDSGKVVEIEVFAGGSEARMVLEEAEWRIRHPWDDRADARAVTSILQFTKALRAEDVAEAGDIDREAAGTGRDGVRIRMHDGDGNRLVDYHMGARTPWVATAVLDGPTGPETRTVPTVFIETRDRGRRNHFYICAGNIAPLFGDGLRFLRDHRPFYFNPAGVQSIGIATEDGELTLGREAPGRPWRITKPLELATDVATMRLLLEKLVDLTAVRLEDLPAPAVTEATNRRNIGIALRNFGVGGRAGLETVLQVRLPEDVEERFAVATVSDRPGTFFTLPVKPEPELVSLADLPLTVNSLRDPTLTNLNIASLGGISIRPATGPEIRLAREPGRPWTAEVAVDGGVTTDRIAANERRLFELLQAVTQARVVSFESDAAVDLAPWGLDRPVLTLGFLGMDQQLLELDFGLDGGGGVFSMRRGTSTVCRMEAGFLDAIAVKPFEWRQARIWSLSKVDLRRIIRMRGGQDPELLEYAWGDEQWTARRGDEDATPELVRSRANFLLDQLEGIECDRWLADDDAKALAALAKPFLRITVFEDEVDGLGDRVGEIRRMIGFAPAADHPGFFYGMLLGNPHPFLIGEEVIRALSISLFDGD